MVTDEHVNAAITLLRGLGYTVELPHLGPWESAKGLWRRLDSGMSYTGFYRRLNAFLGDFPKKMSHGGRQLVRLRTTPDLVAWLSRPPEPGKRRDLRSLDETFGGAR